MTLIDIDGFWRDSWPDDSLFLFVH